MTLQKPRVRTRHLRQLSHGSIVAYRQSGEADCCRRLVRSLPVCCAISAFDHEKPRARVQVSAEPHRVCMAVDESPSAHYAVDWALTNIVCSDKDELYMVSVIVTPEKDAVCHRCFHICCSKSAWQLLKCRSS